MIAPLIALALAVTPVASLPDPNKFDPRSTTLPCDFSGCPPAYKTVPNSMSPGETPPSAPALNTPVVPRPAPAAPASPPEAPQAAVPPEGYGYGEGWPEGGYGPPPGYEARMERECAMAPYRLYDRAP
jgi:hypothetical protein